MILKSGYEITGSKTLILKSCRLAESPPVKPPCGGSVMAGDGRTRESSIWNSTPGSLRLQSACARIAGITGKVSNDRENNGA